MSDIPPVSILGIGAVTPLGRNLESISSSLSHVLMGEGWGEGDPERRAIVDISNHPHPDPLPDNDSTDLAEVREREQALRVSDDLLVDPATTSQLRRADRFTRMAVLAAKDAWNASQKSREGIPSERIGLILSSGFGPHCRGFKFLDGILDAGDTAASPTDFSHSVHGAASAYISRLLDIRGPALNITDFEIGFEETVQIAQCWLHEKSCDRVLIGAVEELGEVMLNCVSRMLDGSKAIVPAEGAVFLMLGPTDIPGIAHLDATVSPVAVDLLIVEDPSLFNSPKTVAAKQTTSFTSAFGHSASATAFSLLGGLLSLSTIDTAATLRTSSEGRDITLLLEK